MDDLTIAFVMRIDGEGLSYSAGLAAAEELAEEILTVAEDRTYALKPGETMEDA